MINSTPIEIPSLDYRPEQYQRLLAAKTERVSAMFAAFAPPQATIFASPDKHFRMRAEFRIWHDRAEQGGRCHYVMFAPDQPQTPIRMTQFPIASEAICRVMSPLIETINEQRELKHKLFQIEFLSTTTGELLVSLIYHRQLDQAWQSAAEQLQQQLSDQSKVALIGRARKQKIVLSTDFVLEQLDVNGQRYRYQQQENSFTQPNAAINCSMIGWLQQYFSSDAQTDMLELYCGNGNFTIPLASRFRRVLATEISKSSIRMAQENCRLNSVSNIEFVRLSSEETSSALNGEREFRRLAHIEIDSYEFSTVLVDPPRAGLDDQTLSLVSRFDTIIYISCNPATLADNLNTLTGSHRIDHFALFDQFPYTDHCECGMILTRKD